MNQRLVAASSVEELLSLVDQELGQFNVVNVVTAFHRLARVRAPARPLGYRVQGFVSGFKMRCTCGGGAVPSGSGADAAQCCDHGPVAVLPALGTAAARPPLGFKALRKDIIHRLIRKRALADQGSGL